LTFGTQARADRRVLISAALLGSGVGLALGAFYMAGGMAQAASDHARAERVAQVAQGDFSESVLQRQASDPAVQRLATAYDPNAATSPDRQLADLNDRLQAGADSAAHKRASSLDCMTDAVYYEARGETKRGQEAVAQVVMNRVKNPHFPKTVCGVVFQRAAGGCQFSFACDGSMRRGRDMDAWAEARRVAARALSGFVLRDVGSATHYHTTEVSPDWGPNMMKVAQVGLHVFYRLSPHARPEASPPEPLQQKAVFTSAPAGASGQPQLRLASAILVKPEPLAPVPAHASQAGAPAPAAAPAAAQAGKDAKAVLKQLPKAAPQGLTKAVETTLAEADERTAS
jgi:spore germination cell wall hydrolase CwlJ-like protein